MITIANETRRNYGNGVTRFWDVFRNGIRIAQLAKGSEPFAKWRVLDAEVSADTILIVAYRNDFTSKAAALTWCEAL